MKMSSPVHFVALQSDSDMCGASLFLRDVEAIILNKKFSKAFLEHCKTSWYDLINTNLGSGFMYDGKSYINCTVPLVTFRHSICDVHSIRGMNPRICNVLKLLFVQTSEWRDIGVDEIQIAALDSRQRL